MTSVSLAAGDGGAAPTTLQVGATVRLAVTAAYEDGTDVPDPVATWASSKPDVATVRDGAVTGVKAGTTAITATVEGKASDPLEVTVTDPPLAALTVTAKAREGGQTLTVTEPVTAGCQRRYLVTDKGKEPTVAYGTVCDLKSGWATFPTDGNVTGTEGQVATVVDCTTSGAFARAKGTATLPAPTV